MSGTAYSRLNGVEDETPVTEPAIAAVDQPEVGAGGHPACDIILSINQRATRTPEEAAAAVAAARSAGRNSVLLLIRRANTPPA